MLDKIVITDITDMFTVFSSKGHIGHIDNRPSFGLSFCADGQITYTHNGNKIISDESCAVILPQNQTYTLRCNKSGVSPVINFLCTEPICETVIKIPISDNKAFIRDYRKMKSLFMFEGNRSEILSIFYHILHNLSSENQQSTVILPAITYLKDNFSNPNLTNTQLADLCNISEVYFRRIFAEQFGMTPHRYITEVRINKAKQLLSEGTLKINAVSAQCGFSNQYHFCRLFKEKTGLTPTEYMLQNRSLQI